MLIYLCINFVKHVNYLYCFYSCCFLLESTPQEYTFTYSIQFTTLPGLYD
jgi:hypothetical protein